METDEPYLDEPLPVVLGVAGQDLDPVPLTQAELAAERRARRERLARRRPVGFAPWPDEPEAG